MVLAVFGTLAEWIIRCMSLLVGYMSNSGTFPQPLSEEEEAEYLRRLQQGDEEARAILIERNLRLVAHIVKKFDNTGEETDDLISVGTVGLIKAIGTFKPDKGTRLATYAARCIENEMSQSVRGGKGCQHGDGASTGAGTGPVSCCSGPSGIQGQEHSVHPPGRDGSLLGIIKGRDAQGELVLPHGSAADNRSSVPGDVVGFAGGRPQTLEKKGPVRSAPGPFIRFTSGWDGGGLR